MMNRIVNQNVAIPKGDFTLVSDLCYDSSFPTEFVCFRSGMTCIAISCLKHDMAGEEPVLLTG